MDRRPLPKVQRVASTHGNDEKRKSGKRENDMPSDTAVEVCFQDSALAQAFGTGQSGRFTPSDCARARKHAGLTQEDVAGRMGTTASAVTRLETFAPGRKHAPTLNTLHRYAKALGCRLILRFEPLEKLEKKDHR